MRSFVLNLAGFAAAMLTFSTIASAQQVVWTEPATTVIPATDTTISPTSVTANMASQVCPKCGKIHGGSAGTSTVIQPTSHQSTTYQSAPPMRGGVTRLRSGGGVSNVLAALNAQRSRQGIGALRYDSQLQAVAQRRAQQMASMGIKSHPPGSFSPGRYEGVGWSSSYSPAGVSACYTSDPNMQYAGAAMATGRDGVYFAVVYR